MSLSIKYQTRLAAWRTQANINTARNGAGGAGINSTAALMFGGYDGTSPGLSVDTESWNGSSWTEVNNLNTGRDNGVMGAGTTTSALYAGMAPPSSPGYTETWNGSSWTEVADLNSARRIGAACGADNEAALVFGGNGTSANTESWNGSSWTETGDLNTSRQQLAGSGITTSAIGIAENAQVVLHQM